MNYLFTGEESLLPDGWKLVRMADVVRETQYGTSDRANSEENGLPVLRMNNITYSGHIDLSNIKWCPILEKDEEKFTVRRGDLLFNRTNSPELVGKTAVWESDEKYAFAGYLIRVRFKPELALSNYVSTYLNSPYGKTYLFNKAKPSINMSNISASEFLKIPLPLPPIEEQRRIAAILDKADAVRRKRKEAIALTEELLRSAFLEMFGNPVTNPKGWDVVPLGDISKVKGGLQVTPKRKDNPIEVPYLRVANVYRDQLVLDEVKLIRVTPEELERTALCTGDLLIVEGHGNSQEIGRSSVWDGSISNCTHQNHLIRVILDSKRAEPTYISAFLNSSGGRRQLIQFGKTTSGLNTISTSNVKATKVLLPPVSEQKKYADLKQKTAVCLGKHQKHFQNTNNLFNSLLQRAFRGEL